MRRFIIVLGGFLLTIVVAIVGAVFAVDTHYGREKLRTFALGALSKIAHGSIRVGRIEGNVLSRFTLVDVAIDDSTGAPFVRVARLSARLQLGPLLRKRIIISDVDVKHADVHLTQTRDGIWNYKRIFPGDSVGTASAPGYGNWVTLTDIALNDTRVMLRRPWEPGSSGTQRDSIVRAAVASDSRISVESTPDGFARTMHFTSVRARIRDAVVADPDNPAIRLTVDSLTTLAAIYKAPVFDVRQMSGDLRIDGDSVALRNLRVALPGTAAHGVLTTDQRNGDVFATLTVDSLAFRDIRSANLRLPDSGGGRLNARVAVRDRAPSDYDLSEISLRVGEATIEGRVLITLGDSLVRFGDTDVRVSKFPTRLVEQLAPAARIPLQSLVSGRAQFAGELTDLRLTMNARVAPLAYPPFDIAAKGGVGFHTRDRFSLSARQLYVRGDRVPLDVARAFDVNPRVGGFASVSGTINGSTAQTMFGALALRHDLRGDTSRAHVRGTVAMEDSMRMNITAQSLSIPLALAREFSDSLDLKGRVSGTAHVQGTARNLDFVTALRLPARGGLDAAGQVRTPQFAPTSYAASVTLRNVAPDAIMPGLPAMRIEGTATLAGSGTTRDSIVADAQARLALFMIDSAEIRNVVLDAHARDGVLSIDSLNGSTSFGAFDVRGTFGLSGAHTGDMEFTGRVDDLAGMRRWLSTGDTTRVPARPRLGARIARERARIDSLRAVARAANDPAAELALALREDSLPRRRRRRLTPVPIESLSLDSTAGSFTVVGKATGHMERANVAATLKTPGIVWNGNEVGAGTVQAAWQAAFTTNDTITIDGGVDSLRAAGFAFDSTRVRGSYRRGEGDLMVVLFPGDTAMYRLETTFALEKGRGQLNVKDIELRMDSANWRSTKPTVISWEGRGLRIDSLDLRDAQAGARLFVDGDVPDSTPGRLKIIAEKVRIAPWLAIAQSDVSADGDLTTTLDVAGTRRLPRLDGFVSIANAQYAQTPFPTIGGSLHYAARSMAVDFTAKNDRGRQLLHVDGTMPIDLAMTGDSIARLPEGAPLSLRIIGDSVPLAPLQELTSEVSELVGTARANVQIAGTWQSPDIAGTAGLDIDRVRIETTGALLSTVRGRLRMSGDTVYVDSLVGRADGVVSGSGTIGLETLTLPKLNLRLNASNALVLDDERGRLYADGTLDVTGAIDSLNVQGSVAVVKGVVFVPDPQQRRIVDAQDPTVFAIADSATVRALGIEGPSTVQRNMLLDVAVDVRRGTFGRSAEANVEVFGNLRVRTERGNPAYLVSGSLHSDRGDYTLYSKRFSVLRGNVRFTGGERVDPLLQLLATYEVQQAGRPPLEIQVVIGGTLERPTVELRSDAHPTLSQSDLISFLAFGRSSSSLLQFSGTGLEGGGSGGSSLAGNVAALATRQLASIGFGALVDEVRSDLAKATRADVLNVTPAQLPADVSLRSFGAVARGTEVELGRYLNERTFVLGRVRPSLTLPGASVEHRLTTQTRARLSLDTRFDATTPSLSGGVGLRTRPVLGALFLWSLAW